jgi:hypothetical protein
VGTTLRAAAKQAPLKSSALRLKCAARSFPALPAGGKTCFKLVYSMTLEEAAARDKAAFPPEFAEGVFCENYELRIDSCARTWMRPHAMENLL